MGHSHSYDCGYDDMGQAIAFATNCTHVEYGDPYDPMGGGCGHINGVQKLYMGWLEGCNMVNTATDGTFNLLPLELPCNGTQVLRVPAWDGRFYYLEYRTPIGRFDDTLAPGGVLVHLADELGDYGPSPYILDKIGHNGFLYAGESFTDPEGVVSFEVIDEEPTHAVIEVTFPDGGSGTPSCLGGGDPGEEAGAIGSLECAAEPFPGDEVAPTAVITYPHQGDVFDPGADFVITADVSDDRLIADVVLYLDSQPVERLYAPPWEWTVTNIPAGSYEFGIVARDSRNQGLSDAVRIQVGAAAGDTSGGVGDESTGGTHDGGGTTSADAADDDGSSGSGENEEQTVDGCGCSHRDDRGLLLGCLALVWARPRRRRASMHG
jgi:hypothetical protein